MWPLRSLAYRTDVFLAGINGEVIDRDRYVVIRTPSNPDFWWGNFLLHREPPTPDVALADHARELPNPRSTLIAWDRHDGEKGHADQFLPLGFVIDVSAILTARASDLVRPPRFNERVVVSPIETDADWAAARVCQINAFAPRRSGSLADLETFIDHQHASFRSMQRRRLGRWWAARIDGETAGVLGLVRVDDSLGRFQLVGVDPRFGRAGVCSTLVHEVARRALVEEGLGTLVMAADASYYAAKVYESVGFRLTEELVAVIKKPPKV